MRREGNRARPLLALTLAASATVAMAGGRVHITNTSKEPWALRIANGPPATVQLQGAPEERVDFSLQTHRPAYVLAPGASCTVTFQERKGSPVGIDIGLVDKAGREAGTLNLEPRPSCVGSFLSRWFGRGEDVVRPAAPTAAATRKPVDESWFIHADYWGDPF